MSDMPPSYEIATGNVIASHRRLLTPLNPTRTENLDSKDYSKRNWSFEERNSGTEKNNLKSA